jgi:hypothetical protein
MPITQLYTLNGTGTEIPAFVTTASIDEYIIKGSVIAIGNYTLVPSGTPIQGTTIIINYEGNLDITTNSTTFSVFGTSINQTLLSTKWRAQIYYDGVQWVVQIIPNSTQAFITSANLTNSSVTNSAIAVNSVATNQLQNGSVTTPILATNSVSTLKIIANAVTNSKLAHGPDASIKCTNPSGNVTDIALSNDQLLINRGGILVPIDRVNILSGFTETITVPISFESGEQAFSLAPVGYPYNIKQVTISIIKNIESTDNATVEIESNIMGPNSFQSITIAAGTTNSSQSNVSSTLTNSTATTGSYYLLSVRGRKNTPGGKCFVSLVVERI